MLILFTLGDIKLDSPEIWNKDLLPPEEAIAINNLFIKKL